MTDWTLRACCNTDQIIFICLIGGFSVILLLLWRSKILLPLKLLTVFLHELSHAIGAWLSCGKVEKIVVEENEGGHTLTRGGSMCCILPAGYLGSSFWGCFFIVMGAASRTSAYVAAVMLCVALLGVMVFLAGNCLARCLCLFFLTLVIGLFVADVMLDFNFLQYLLVFFGLMNALYSVFDIFEDLIARKVAESDAYKFAETYGGHARCWGCAWCIVAFVFLALAMYFSLLALFTNTSFSQPAVG